MRKMPPYHGPFRNPDLPHQGYNKTIGANFAYKEDPADDPISFKKNVKVPIWKDPTLYRTEPMLTVHDNFKNRN